MAETLRPRLLVLASTYPRWSGDSEPAFVHELARRLSGRFEVTVITPHARGAKRREILDGVSVLRYRYAPTAMETLVHGGGIVTHLRRAPWKWLLVPGFVLMQVFVARRAIACWRPVLIHAHWLLPQGLVARLLASHGVPYVLTSHGADLFALRGRWFARCRRWVMARAAATSVVSQAMRCQLEAESPHARVAVMPMGVDARQRFTPDAAVPRVVGELLFVGRLVEKKGLHYLVEAMPAILAEHPEVRLTIVGFGPAESLLRNRIDRLGLGGAVQFLGAMASEALPALYRRATLFVAPFVQARSGDQEGLGLVVAEAMACGCPVVAGDVPGVRDLAADGCAALVEPANPGALAATVITLLADAPGRARLAAVARARVLERFDWQAVAARYADFLAAASELPRR